MQFEFILFSQENGIAKITLNRPDKRNAIHTPMIKELSFILNKLAEDETRVVLINGSGPHFCAGGDIAWMLKMTQSSSEENVDDSQMLADLLYQVYTFPKPTLVLAQGTTVGGGLGLLAAADIAIAAKNATFCLPEVKLGLAPSMISPYVITAMGERAAHYYFLTGEHFVAEAAFRMGLVQQLADESELMDVGINLAKTLMENGPKALLAVKHLIRYVAKTKITAALAQQTAEHLANLRTTPEAQEGLHAFLEKRKPKWSDG